MPGDPKVAIRVSGIDIVLNTIREQVYSPDVFAAVGIDVTGKDIVVVKSSQHFHTAFAPVAAEIIYCNTPGALNQELAQIPFTNVRRPIWPLDDTE